jgi:predicted GH43/DUF377 family glycosyl hydrolase
MVAKEGDRYRMWYSGSDREENEYHRIGYAESPDGISWIRRDEPVLVPHDPDGYYTNPCLLRDPHGNLMRVKGGYMIWFTGMPQTSDLHLATSTDGISWQLHDPDPLGLKAYSPTILLERGIYRMWYAQVPIEGPMAIGYAESRDGANWRPSDLPVMASTEEWEHRNLLYPFVIKRGGLYEMYYTSYGSHICELALATSTDGISWEKGDGPILSPDPRSSYDSLYCSKACLLQENGIERLYYASRIDMIHKYYAIALAERRGR